MTDQQRTSILASKVHCVRYRFTTVATVTSDRLVGIDDSTVIFVVRRDGAGHNQRVGRLFRVRRLAVVLVLLPLALSVAPVPASAHPSGSNPDAAYYQADLAEITPARPDVVVRVDPRGEWIDLTYTGDTEVVVLGYTGEPYLRVTATTTAENLVSQTTYLNKAMFADIPTSGRTASAAPTWQPIDGAGTVRWHDHRIHWMGQARPPDVERPVKCGDGIAVVCPSCGWAGWGLSACQFLPCPDRCPNRGRVGGSWVSRRLIA
jgi:hypothetical protein